MNAIRVIRPYKWHGIWVFDDPDKGLVREAFVSGADTIIDRLTGNIPDAGDGFVMLFSDVPFPSHDAKFVWMKEGDGGNYYHFPALDMQGWLCPALLKYFDGAPKEIYVELRQRPPGALPYGQK